MIKLISDYVHFKDEYVCEMYRVLKLSNNVNVIYVFYINLFVNYIYM